VSGSGIITPTLQHANWNISSDARLRAFASATTSSSFLKYKPKYKDRVSSFFQAPSQNCEKSLLASCLSVRLSVLMEQLGTHWTDFHEIWHLNISRESVRKFKFG
jgi:hypothetical protein